MSTGRRQNTTAITMQFVSSFSPVGTKTAKKKKKTVGGPNLPGREIINTTTTRYFRDFFCFFFMGRINGRFSTYHAGFFFVLLFFLNLLRLGN